MLSLDFQNHFSALEDPRIINHNTRHRFMDILVMAFVANLCGCDDWVETAYFCKLKQKLFEQFLDLPNGIPSHDTFGRVFSMIDTEHFEVLFAQWMSALFIKTNGEIVAIDGKTIRGSRKAGELKGIHLVNAWACDNNLTLGAMAVEDKTNEITVIPKLLRILNIAHCTVTIDAMGCQHAIAEAIINKKSNYVLAVKDNQRELKTGLEIAFRLLDTDKNPVFFDSGDEKEEGHGRTENRRYISLPFRKYMSIKSDWAGIESVTKVIRTRTINMNISEEVSYFISSHPYHSDRIKKAIRAHWRIENNLHWQLDVSFNEDRCRARIRNEAKSIALIRRMTMALLKKDIKTKVGIKCKRKKAGWDDQYLLEIIAASASAHNCATKLTQMLD